MNNYTCKNRIKEKQGQVPRLYCSQCHAVTTVDIHKIFSETAMIWPNFCGKCGAEVVEE